MSHTITVTKPTIRVRAGFSIPLIKAASEYALRAGLKEDKFEGAGLCPVFDEVRQDVIGAVIMSVAAMESNINEFLFDDDSLPDLKKPAKETVVNLMERNSILDKYQDTLRLAEKEPFNSGEEPLQSAKVLVRLRNAFVHFKPEWSDEQVEHDQIGKQILGKFKLGPFMPEHEPVFPDRCMSKGCANWAVRSTLQFIKVFFKKAECEIKFGESFYDEIIEKHKDDA